MDLTAKFLVKCVTGFVLALEPTVAFASSAYRCLELFQNESISKTRVTTPAKISENALRHILLGDYNSSGQLDGGMHTVDGFLKLYEQNRNLVIEWGDGNLKELKELISIANQLYPREGNPQMFNAKVKALANGVLVIELPAQVLTANAHHLSIITGQNSSGSFYLKTTFPMNWSKAFVKQTIEDIARQATHEEIINLRSMTRNVNGVLIALRFNDKGEVGSAFPTFRQSVSQAVSVPKLPALQRQIVEQNFIAPRLKYLEDHGSIYLIELLEKAGVDYTRQDWPSLIAPQLRNQILREFKTKFGLEQIEVLAEGLSLGFDRLPSVRESLIQNLGYITFINRLNQERHRFSANQIKQRSRSLLTHFGLLSPTAQEIEAVSQILSGRQAALNREFINKLNSAAMKSLMLYYRPGTSTKTAEEVMRLEASMNWFSIFFSDL